MVACESVCVCNWELGVKLSTLPSSAYYCKVFFISAVGEGDLERFLAGSLVMSQAPLRVRASGMKLAPTLRNFLSISLDMSATHDFVCKKFAELQCLFLQPDRQKKTEAWNQPLLHSVLGEFLQ